MARAPKLTASSVLDPYAGIPACGYTEQFKVPAFDSVIRDSFNGLAQDQYAYGGRTRAFSQFIAFYNAASELVLDRLEHRPFVQSKENNSHSGGILREFEPLSPDINIKPQIEALFEKLKIDPSQKFHLDIHQYRVDAEPEAQGVPVPEGIHRDGMECVAILVVDRVGITKDSATFRIIDPATKKVMAETVMGAGEAILLKDEDVLHDATKVRVLPGHSHGYRDYFVVNINLWENARYGQAHELRCVGDNPDAIEQIKTFWKKYRTQPKIAAINKSYAWVQDNFTGENAKAIESTLASLQKKVAALGGFNGLSFTQQDLSNAQNEITFIKQAQRADNLATLSGVENENWAEYTDVDAVPDDLFGVLRGNCSIFTQAQAEACVLGVQGYGNGSALILTTNDAATSVYASIVEEPFEQVMCNLAALGISLQQVPGFSPRATTALNRSLVPA